MTFYQTETPDSVYIPASPPVTRTIEYKVRDWLPWSVINVLLGSNFGGLIPLVFSIRCRIRKRNHDLHRAQTMSKLALIFNIIITIVGIGAWITFAVLFVHARRSNKL